METHVRRPENHLVHPSRSMHPILYHNIFVNRSRTNEPERLAHPSFPQAVATLALHVFLWRWVTVSRYIKQRKEQARCYATVRTLREQQTSI